MTPSRSLLLLGVFFLATAAPAAAQENAPVKALSERAANPKGPFARLNVPQRDSIIEHTRALLGTRYKWAGISPEKGLDCSGFVK
ncbi:MAG: hypothetical protein ACHQQ3_08635, partial [Gemmatimonadales bacterium]